MLLDLVERVVFTELIFMMTLNHGIRGGVPIHMSPMEVVVLALSAALVQAFISVDQTHQAYVTWLARLATEAGLQ